MKYRLGYDYYWNFAELFRYKGKVVLGANINVLFSPIFECTEAKYKENEYYPEQQYQGAYLFEYFVPEFDSTKKTFTFMPTAKGKNIKGISFNIISFELAVLGAPNMELESSLPSEFRGMPHMEPFKVTEKEFMDLFSNHEFTDLQSNAYFGKRVDSSELREQGQVKKKK